MIDPFLLPSERRPTGRDQKLLARRDSIILPPLPLTSSPPLWEESSNRLTAQLVQHKPVDKLYIYILLTFLGCLQVVYITRYYNTPINVMPHYHIHM